MTEKVIKKDICTDGFRFLIAGGINTLITLGIYQLGLLFMKHEVAYSLSWIAGIIFLMVFYPTRVFPEGNNTWQRKTLILLLYILNFFISLWLLDQAVSYGVIPEIAVFFALIYSISINFIGTRVILRGGGGE